MQVEGEIAVAKRKRNFGLVVQIISMVFILASAMLGMYDYSAAYGPDLLRRLFGFIIYETQFPILTSVWSTAAHPDFVDPLVTHNLWFAGEISIFILASCLRFSGGLTLKELAEAKHKAKQESRQEQFKKKELDRVNNS